MTHEEEVLQEIFMRAYDHLGEAWDQGKPYLFVSLRGDTIWDVTASAGRRGTVEILTQAMDKNSFLRDVIMDAAKTFALKQSIEVVETQDVSEILFNKNRHT
jgi:fumarylacetoacetate (FAA) hydrolase family protein